MLVAMVALLLAACGPGQQQERARLEREQSQKRQLEAQVERCRAELPKLNASLTTLERLDNALQAPPARGYQPPPKPQPPNPEQLARLASYDQELELDNHAKALAAWEADKRWGERQWKRRRSEQRQTLERQRQAEIKALGQANPRLVVSSDGSTSPELDPAAVAVYTSCAPDALAKLAGPPAP